MSATLPPTAGLDRPSDFGEFWQQAESASRMHSVVPETEPAAQALTPEQNARRKRLQGVVAGVISGLVVFTALAAIVYAVKRHNEAALVIAGAAAKPAPPVMLAAPPAGASPTLATVTSQSGTESSAALAPTPAAAATLRSRQTAAHPDAPARSHASVARPKALQTRAVHQSARKPLSR